MAEPPGLSEPAPGAPEAPAASPPAGRKRLQLKKRDPAAAAANAASLAPSSGKANPFGAARPREEILQGKGVDARAEDRKREQKTLAAKRLTRMQREEADVAGRARADREYFGGRLAYRVFSRRGALATDKLAFYAFLNREGFRLARDARHDALARGARPAPRVELVPRGVDRSASSARSRRRAAGRREPTRRVT